MLPSVDKIFAEKFEIVKILQQDNCFVYTIHITWFVANYIKALP